MPAAFIARQGLWRQSGIHVEIAATQAKLINYRRRLTVPEKHGKLCVPCFAGLTKRIKIYRTAGSGSRVNLRTIVARGLAPK
jgi:hypothetical protein